jgi:hypothetical protein
VQSVCRIWPSVYSVGGQLQRQMCRDRCRPGLDHTKFRFTLFEVHLPIINGEARLTIQGIDLEQSKDRQAMRIRGNLRRWVLLHVIASAVSFKLNGAGRRFEARPGGLRARSRRGLQMHTRANAPCAR